MPLGHGGGGHVIPFDLIVKITVDRCRSLSISPGLVRHQVTQSFPLPEPGRCSFHYQGEPR